LPGGSITYNPNANLYEFIIPVEISSEASNRFSKIVKRIPTTFAGQRIILNGFLVYYLDGNPISQLNIPIELTRQTIKQLSIIGFSKNMVDATNTRSKILSSVESGILPVHLEIVGSEVYEPKLKSFSTEVFGLGICLSAAFIFLIFYLRYKNLKLGFLAILLSLTELFLILGVIATAQQIGVAWVINLTIIFSFIAVLLISNIQAVILSEQNLKKRSLSISYKYKRLISISTLLSLITLIIGFVFLFTELRFFGLTLITGFLLDILLIRPIFKGLVKEKIF
jgi:preprotein translocase subunit SecD